MLVSRSPRMQASSQTLWSVLPVTHWGPGDESWTKKDNHKESFWYQTQGPGRLAQTPWAGTGESAGRFRRCLCLTVFNFGRCGSNLSMCGTFSNKCFVGCRHCAAAFSLQASKSCTDLDRSLLYILIWGAFTKFGCRNQTPGASILILRIWHFPDH